MSMRTSVTGLNAAQTELSTIANNLANASTSGFKASRVEFADIFAADASKVTPGAGVRVAGVTQMMKQGGLEFTGQNLDLAINGNGFFVMRDSNEQFTYTRSGNFRLNTVGDIVNPSGSKLMFFAPRGDGTFNETEGGLISIKADAPNANGAPLTRLDVDQSGILRASYSDGSVSDLGKIAVATFSTPTNLAQLGDTTWRATLGSGGPSLAAPGVGDRGKIEAGALEGSNVDIAEQLVHMITAQRNFQANAKSISTADAIAQSIINIR
jgi:flagellar hook protein FlgE